MWTQPKEASTEQQNCFKELGITEAVHKRNKPETAIVWLGVHFDKETAIMSITEEKIAEAINSAQGWLNKEYYSSTELKSFLGNYSTSRHVLRLLGCS